MKDARLDRMTARLAAIDARYDDVARARAEARLDAALDAAPVTRRRRAPIAIATIAAFATAAAVALVLSRPRDLAARAAPLLRPFVVAPTGEVAAPPPVPRDGDRVDAPAGWLIRAALGDAATVTVIGPGSLAATRDGDTTTLTLARGRVLGRLDPAAHQHLRLVAGGEVVTITGTVFAVDAKGSVAVLEGRVRVALGGREIEVGAGQAWRAGSLGAIDPSTAAALTEHAAQVPPREPAVAVTLSGDPADAEIWLGDRRIASTPAWLRVGEGTSLRVAAVGFADASVRVTGTGNVSFSLGRAPLADKRNHMVAKGNVLSPEPPPRERSATPRPSPVPQLPPPQPPPPPSPPAETAASLYADADRALAAGDRDGARSALRALVDRFAGDPLADTARYELATFAHASGDRTGALRYLDAIGDPSLTEPADFLRCKVMLDAGDRDAASCLSRFRTAHPGSVHDADALALLASLRFGSGDCNAARPLLEEYLRTYPKGSAAEAARDRLTRCP